LSWKKWVGPLLGLFFLGLVILNHNLPDLIKGIVLLQPRKIFNPDLQLGMIINHLRNVDYRLLSVACLISLVQFPLRAIRWKYLLLPRKRIAFPSLFSATMIGFMANNLLPARMGEFVRAYIISRKESVSGSSAMATIIIERLFDGFALLTILLVVFYTYSFPTWVVVIGWWATAIFFFLFVFLIAMTVWPNGFASVLSNVGRIFSHKVKKKTESLILRFISGLDILRDRRLVFFSILLSLMQWTLMGWAFAVALDSFNIIVPRSGPYFVLSIVALGVALPTSPGFIGTYQWFTERALSVYGVSKNLSISFSGTLHIISFIPPTLIGFIYFLKEHLTWKELKKTEEEIKEEEIKTGTDE
jgi:uncharacterized protein (TIRG00374 family)